MRPSTFVRARVLPSLLAAASVLAGSATALLGTCGPFTDVAADVFCPFVLEVFYLGITTGTTATTYDPAGNVTRLQMAAFLSRSVDTVLRRGERAALGQFWNPKGFISGLSQTTVGGTPTGVACDGLDVWVANNNGGSVSRVRAGDGRLLETWTGMQFPGHVLSCLGRILVTGQGSPGKLYLIDPSQPAGSASVAATLDDISDGMAFDGGKVWVANGIGSVSIVTPGASLPWTVTTLAGFNLPTGVVYDGSNVWVVSQGDGTLLKLSSAGAVLQTVTVGTNPKYPAFDGTNLWVPNFSDASVSVVRASTGAVLATLTGVGLSGAQTAAFDGQRILITGYIGNTISIWKAADLTQVAGFPTGGGTNPYGVASDGINFWVSLSAAAVSKLVRF